MSRSSPPIQRRRDLDDAGDLLHMPYDAHSLPGFRQWILSDQVPEKLRLSYLRGQVIVDMSKVNLQTHAAVNASVAETLLPLTRKLDFGNLYINGVIVTNVAADVSTNPDMVAISWEALSNGTVHYLGPSIDQEMESEDSPDWVLEIVSKSSVKKDKQELRQAYHEAGIREYWIIDARGDQVEFQILQWRKTGYVASLVREDWHRSRVFRGRFQMTRLRDRRRGWRYDVAYRAA